MTRNIVTDGILEDEKFEKFVKKPVEVDAYQTDRELHIETLEGTMRADKGDYIIKGVKGEPYPCKPDIFDMTYLKNPSSKKLVLISEELLEKIRHEFVSLNGVTATDNMVDSFLLEYDELIGEIDEFLK